ncbi:MAG: hypothetical protein JWL79_3799 [Frankiales bacterium]|nr:hypothetical protein [Frankiales bacterium]
MRNTDVHELLSRSAERVLVPPLDIEALKAEAQRRGRQRHLPMVGTFVAVVLIVSLVSVLANGLGSKKDPRDGAPPPTAAVDTYANGVWPFTTKAQAAAWRTDPAAMPWAGDKAQVVQHYLTDVLQLPDLRVDSLGCPECFEQHITDQTGAVQADAAIVGDDAGPFSIANITDGRLVLVQPEQFGQINSPTEVAGHNAGALGKPSLRLVASNGKSLSASASVHVVDAPNTPADSLGWSSTLTWSDANWAKAGIVAVTRSRLGDVTALAMLPVSRGR